MRVALVLKWNRVVPNLIDIYELINLINKYLKEEDN